MTDQQSLTDSFSYTVTDSQGLASSATVTVTVTGIDDGIRRIGTIKKGEEAIGNETKVKVVKNKVAPPFKTAEFDILFGEGISREGEIIALGVNAKVVDKSGAWYAYNKERIGQGKDNAREYLIEHPEIAAEIEAKIREHLGVKNPVANGLAKAEEA